MAKQIGFYYDATRCVGCRTCELACKSTHNIESGIKWRRVLETWEGQFPTVSRSFLSLACLHCAEPACIEACPTEAIYKRTEDGIVVVDRDKCNGCQDCFAACPFGVPQFGKDGIMQKCDFCLSLGTEPACASSCPAEALSYGTMEDLSKLALAGRAENYPGNTEPSFIIRK
jgi:anaerobic dimethyl sulfoxide reductase subunit B (iron-sulfur subunit)